ncbi:cell number regulator 8 isoform X2 [Phragmites australis]|uniref:cell number regulator 8 isoform X2 n=1 Tax=Phragmites australis TaxID=29695 RepID=UPI002D79934E|nr:cell number regulator 8 isoform X2 [Phragmites australis]
MGAAADNHEESSPLLPTAPAPEAAKGCADGFPVVMGEPVASYAGGVPRESWDSGILSCLGRNDEFCSSDLEVCLIGSIAPCVLYGSNVERLAAGQGTFANSCLPYTGLYMLGNSLFGWNCLAPWFSHPTRTAIRRRYNLEGSFEAFTRQCGCCRGLVEDEERREHLEVACDLATHYVCHPCALCQEGRELRRRVPHPGFNNSVLVMMPPMEQTMGRGM